MTEALSPEPPLLEFRGVTRRYRRQERAAVAKVDLAVREGEILALVGESGSGKTTLLRLAAGLESPDAGQVLLEGRTVAGEGVAGGREVPPERRRLGLVFQDGALFPHLDAAANAAYGLHRLARDERKRRAARCLDLVGLSGKEQRYPHELSGGERQRLALARALAPEPRLVLLDEPFSHLDPALRRHLREEIRGILHRLGQTVVLVTHDPEDALAMATRVAILQDGAIRQVGAPSEVYLEPADRYCAERFGPANAVADPGGGGTAWRRPDEAIWDSSSGEGRLVRVVEIRDTGRALEARVALEPDAEETWLISLPPGAAVVPGDQGRVRWRR